MDFSATTGKEISCKAAVVWEYNKPIAIENVQVKTPGPMEVRIKIVASGMCHSDWSSMKGYLSMQSLPFVAGHEGAGIVESVGQGVTSVKPGDKVLTSFFPQCRKCPPCLGTRTNMCLDIGRKIPAPLPLLRDFGYDGQLKFSCKGQDLYMQCGCSCFSEYTVIPENSCVKIDARAPLEKMCIVACGFSTGYGSATNVVSIRAGDAVAVWGMGGVGLAAVIGCQEKGAATIIGVDTNANKEAAARKMGCTDFVNAKDSDSQSSLKKLIDEKTDGGLDFAFVCIGNTDAMEQAVYLTKTGGTVVIVGVARAEEVFKVSPLFLLGSRKIVGALFGDYKVLDDLPKIVDRYLNGKLPQIDDFITKTITLDQIHEGFKIMETGER